MNNYECSVIPNKMYYCYKNDIPTTNYSEFIPDLKLLAV